MEAFASFPSIEPVAMEFCQEFNQFVTVTQQNFADGFRLVRIGNEDFKHMELKVGNKSYA